jgi:hypothetical protein
MPLEMAAIGHGEGPIYSNNGVYFGEFEGARGGNRLE